MIYLVADTHGENTYPPKDCKTLIHLGDDCGSDFPASFSGKRILIRGNHDDNPALFATWDFVCDGLLVDNLWLTHEPQFTLPLGAHKNIHGHLHNNPYEEYGYIKRPFHVLLEPKKFYKLEDLV
jgi:predicted phosphodiesterase